MSEFAAHLVDRVIPLSRAMAFPYPHEGQKPQLKATTMSSPQRSQRTSRQPCSRTPQRRKACPRDS
jgi:hypothetical protein